MDTFTLLNFGLNDTEVNISEEITTDRPNSRVFQAVQFSVLPEHLGMAMAMRNYWVYLYASRLHSTV